MYWRHATGAADAANLKGETPCERDGGFEVLKGEEDALLPVGALPDHFTSQWGNEFPNHACDSWPYGGCKGVIGYNTISSPEECCEACATLRWVEEMGGDVSKVEVLDEATGATRFVHANPCVAWQVVGGKCRIMREQMVREHPRFAGRSVRDAILSGGGCDENGAGERSCNYYSFARFRETFELQPIPSPTPQPTPVAVKLEPGDNQTNETLAARPEPAHQATFAKMALLDLLDGKSAEEYLEEAAQGRNVTLNIDAAITTLAGRGSSQRMDLIREEALAEWAESLAGNTSVGSNATCAKIRLFTSTDLAHFQDGSVSLPVGATAPRPWCESEICVSSGILHVQCSVTQFALQLPLEGRRLSGAEAPTVAIVFGSDGTGKDESNFENVRVTLVTTEGDGSDVPTRTPSAQPTPAPMPGSPTPGFLQPPMPGSPSPQEPIGDPTSGSFPASAPHALGWLITVCALALTAAMPPVLQS